MNVEALGGTRRLANYGFGRYGRFAVATFMLAVTGLLASPGVKAETLLSLNGASGSSTYSLAQSTTGGGLVINQVFGVEYLVVAGGGGGGGGIRTVVE